MSSQAMPRYQQLKALIIGRISSGELKPSDRVPSENELVDQTGVSRMTANRALNELDAEGYVERIVGKGTFVADFRAVSDVLEVRNIADEIALRGHRHSSRLLQNSKGKTDESIAGALKIGVGKPVLHVRVIHFENGIAVQLEDRFVRPDFAPQLAEQDFADITPSAYLSSISPLQEAEHVVRAQLPAADVARHLDIAASEPCLVVTRRTWAGGRPVTYANLYHPGDRFELAGHYSPPGAPRARHDSGLKNDG